MTERTVCNFCDKVICVNRQSNHWRIEELGRRSIVKGTVEECETRKNFIMAEGRWDLIEIEDESGQRPPVLLGC